MYKGIDLSKYQANVDYEKLKEDGIEFAIIQCGYGREQNQKDPMFETHYEGLKKAGIKVGAYLYSYCNNVNNAILEAENCLKFIEGKHFDLPIFYDLEETATRTLGKESVTKIAQIFCERIEQAGYKAGVYANLDWFKNYINVAEIDKYYIWLAQWSDNHSADFRVDFWQYTSQGKILAIPNQNVDMNYQYTEITNDEIESDNKFEINKTYTLQVDLNVREFAGTSQRIKQYSELTEDGKKHAFNQNNAVLKTGTRVTCLDIVKIGNDEWIKIPSGYIAGFYDGKFYVK